MKRYPLCPMHGTELRPANLVWDIELGESVCIDCDRHSRVRAAYEAEQILGNQIREWARDEMIYAPPLCDVKNVIVVQYGEELPFFTR